MKTKPMRVSRVLAMLLCGFAAFAAPVAADPPTQDAVAALAADVGADRVRDYEAMLAEAVAAGVDSPHAALGLVAFMNQELELATWLYGLGVLAEPDNPVYLNNFGLGLHEKALMATGGTDPRLLALARDSFVQALAHDPGNATFHNNLGMAELERWRAEKNADTLAAAIAAFRQATSIDPKSATAWAHLAEALAASADTAGAAEALAKSRKLAPFNGALLSAGPRLPAAVVSASLGDDGAACQIDYGCDANCPRSIIGQIDLVTCRIAESSAQSACSEGRVYAPAFDCAEKIPEFGILFPGLNSGFSMPTPFGRLDATVDGAGNVQFRFKWSTNFGAVGGEVTTQGGWSPESGFTSVEIKPGITYSFVGGDAAEHLNELEMGPFQIGLEGNSETRTTEIKIEVYGGSVLSH
jgi:tetratricopeptide (TPR) repeat protein